VRQHRPLFPYFDQAKFGQTRRSLSLTGDIFSRRDWISRSAQRNPDGSFERKISERVICHPCRLVLHFDQTLAVRRLLLADPDNAVIGIRFYPGPVRMLAETVSAAVVVP
jgi:hypothetical protein